MNRFILLLASNSEAEKNMAIARMILTKAFPEGIRFSENHWSAAVVSEGHRIPKGINPMYLNAVSFVETESDLEDVQIFLKKTESDMGRIRGIEAQGQVVIDLDLVEWNGTVLRPKDADQEYYTLCLKDLYL